MLDEAHAAFTGLDNWLETRTYLAGERLTVADLAIAAQEDWVLRFGVLEEFTKYRNALRHYNTVVGHPKFVEALTVHKGLMGLPKPMKAKKEGKKKEEKKQAKEAKPAATVVDEEDDDDFTPREEKKKNPLDLLAPSRFVLDAFKREYANKDTRTEAAPFFFDNFDSTGFSAYWCKYKYNDELSKTFMTRNLVRGWFQRMEQCRKYAFSSVVILGEEGKMEIAGFWIFRGKGIPEIAEDTDLYDWVEIHDINAEKEKITDFLAWDGASFATTPVLEGRAFK